MGDAPRPTKKGVRTVLSAFLAEKWQTQKFGRDIVSSADLCYNGMGDDNGRVEKTQEYSIEGCRL